MAAAEGAHGEALQERQEALDTAAAERELAQHDLTLRSQQMVRGWGRISFHVVWYPYVRTMVTNHVSKIT